MSDWITTACNADIDRQYMEAQAIEDHLAPVLAERAKLVAALQEIVDEYNDPESPDDIGDDAYYIASKALRELSGGGNQKQNVQ